MTRAKICGLTGAADLEVALQAGADAVGVICEVPVETPREVDRATAARLLERVPPFASGVLVTMPDSVEGAIDLVEDTDPTAVQVHGGLAPAKVGGLAARLDRPVLVAVAHDDPDVGAYAAAADALVVDSRGESGGGGTGEVHDWSATQALLEAVNGPLVLAGGLTPANVAEAVETVGPYAVDTASGVEADPGRKDHEAVRSFVASAHAAEGSA
jgi:phosphoribosylanthranilate isomerase